MMNPSTTEQMQILETIESMRTQEENHYRYHVTDYLSELSNIATTTSLDTAPVDASYRSVMGKRCNDIADLCNYKRETVAIAMNCLDRFMATQPSYEQQEILFDRNLYQLAAMIALYISAEIHEKEMDPQFLLSKLSHGGVQHTTETIEAMEFEMLNAIEWRVNPPTAMSFTRLIINNLDLLVSDNHYQLSPCEKEQIIDLTRIQIELTVNEYDFSTFNGSSIAYACMLNAFEIYLGSGNDDDDDDGMFLAHIETTIGKTLLVDEEECIQNLQDAIYELMNDCDDDNDNSSSICQELLHKNSSTTAIMTNKDDLSCADVITTGGNKNEGFHSSPCTVVTSFCELECLPFVQL